MHLHWQTFPVCPFAHISWNFSVIPEMVSVFQFQGNSLLNNTLTVHVLLEEDCTTVALMPMRCCPRTHTCYHHISLFLSRVPLIAPIWSLWYIPRMSTSVSLAYYTTLLCTYEACLTWKQIRISASSWLLDSSHTGLTPALLISRTSSSFVKPPAIMTHPFCDCTATWHQFSLINLIRCTLFLVQLIYLSHCFGMAVADPMMWMISGDACSLLFFVPSFSLSPLCTDQIYINSCDIWF